MKKLLVSFLCLLALHARAAEFSVGKTVLAGNTINVRSEPEIVDETLLGEQTRGASGVITDGPVVGTDTVGNEVIWWKIDWQEGPDGWSGQDRLVLAELFTGKPVLVAWQDNSSNETGFIIERASGLDATENFQPVGTVDKDVQEFVDSRVEPETPYTYRVCAFNSAGKSAYSNTASVTTKGTIPAAPSDTEASDGPDFEPPETVILLPVGNTLKVVSTE